MNVRLKNNLLTVSNTQQPKVRKKNDALKNPKCLELHI